MARQVTIEIRDSTNAVDGILELADSETFPLAVTYTIADIRDLNERSGDYSKNFKIPATNANKNLLEYIHHTNLSDSKEMRDRKPSVIKVNGVIVARGSLKINSVETLGDFEEYDVTFFGNNLEWVTLAAETTLDQLDFSSFVYDQSTIESTWTGNRDSDAFFFPIINYGQWHTADEVTVEDMRPALYIDNIVDTFFDSINYNLVSNFFDHADFQNLIYPFIGNGFNYTEEEVENEQIDVNAGGSQTRSLNGYFGFIKTNGDNNLVFAIDFPVENSDPGNNWVANTYTARKAGKYKFKADVTFEIDDFKEIFYTDGKTAKIELFRNGTFLYSQETANVDTSITTPDPFSEKIVLETPHIDLAIGDTVQIKMNFTGRIREPLIANPTIKITSASKLVSGGLTEIAPGETIAYSDIANDDNILEFINGLTHLFNLYWWTDVDTKTVYVEPRNDWTDIATVAQDGFYDDLTDALSWTEKLDISEAYAVEFEDSYKRELEFRYKEDSSDGYLTERNRIMNNILASYEHVFPDRFPKGEEGTENPFFSYTYNIFDTDVVKPDSYVLKVPGGVPGSITINRPTDRKDGILLPRLWSDFGATPTEYSNDYAPRILNKIHESHNDSTGNPVVLKWEGTERTLIPTGMPNSFGVYSDFLELSYSGMTQKTGLFEKYYGGTINTIEKGTMIQSKFYLNPLDIHNLDMRNVIHIERPFEIKGYWVINEIKDFTPHIDQVTAVVLTKIENLAPITIDTDQDGNKGDGVYGDVTEVDGDKNNRPPITTGGGVTKSKDLTTTGYRTGNPSVTTPTSKSKPNTTSISWGIKTISNGEDQVVTGVSNKPDPDKKFIIGIGDLIPANGMTFGKDGLMRMYGGKIWTEINAIYEDVVVEIDGELHEVFLSDD